MANSTVPAAKAWLVAHIATAVNNVDVLTIQGLPDEFQPDDIILVDRIERQVTAAAFGDATEEDYTIYLTISCFAGGESSQVASDRAEALAALVEGVVRADPSMGGLLLNAEPSRSSSEPSWDDDHKGHMATNEVAIACLADI